MASGGTDNLVRLWDIRMGKTIQVGVGHSGRVSCRTRCAASSTVASHGVPSCVQVAAVKFSPDDKQLVSVGEDGCVFVWNVYGSS